MAKQEQRSRASQKAPRTLKLQKETIKDLAPKRGVGPKAGSKVCNVKKMYDTANCDKAIATAICY